MIDSRAIELAASASTDAKRAIEIAENNRTEFVGIMKAHEAHDNERFDGVQSSIDAFGLRMSEGFKGIHNRMWAAAGGFLVLAFALIVMLLGKAL